MKQSYIFTMLFITGILFTCNKTDNLYDPDVEEGVTINAFVSDTTGLSTDVSQDSIEDILETELTMYVGHTVTFLGFINGDSSSLSWKWDFGDKNSSTHRIVEHAYSTEGNYIAVFFITDESEFSLLDTILIYVREISGAAIRGYAFYEGKSGHDSIEIIFKSEISVLNPIYTNKTGLYHVASDFPSGIYTIFLTPVKKPGYPSDTLKEIEVENGVLTVIDSVVFRDTHMPHITPIGPLGTISIRQPDITADFNDTCSGIAPETFVLILNGDTIADSLIDIDASNFSWTPDYRLPDGKYSVVTSIKDSANNSEEIKWNFTVDAMKLTVMNDTTVRINDTAYLHGAVSNVYSNVEEYKWDFYGNGTWDDSVTTSDLEISRPHVYTHAAIYKAVLYARDDSGMVKCDTVKVQVHNDNPIITELTVDKDTISIFDSVTFTLKAFDNDGEIEKVQWDYNADGTFDFESDSVVTKTGYKYNSVGKYNAAVRLTDDDDKTTEDNVTIAVLQDIPVINFASDDTIVSYGGTVKCSVYVQQQFGTITVEMDTANDGNWVTVADDEVSAVKNIAVGTASDWDSVKVKITDDDGNYSIYSI